MKHKRLIKQMVIPFSLCFASTVIWADETETRVDPDVDFNGSDCIWIRSIRDYTPLDDQSLLIWSGPRRPYYVRLFRSTRDMRSAFNIRVESRDDRLCPYGGDGLLFGSFERFPVGIRSISRISIDQADELLIRHGKKETEEPQTPAPRDVGGAEVEELD